MALVIHMKKKQRIIINGAVLENVSGKTVSIAVRNQAAVLRSEDVLTAGEAVTPASRVYFALQCAFLFPASKAEHLRDFDQLLQSYLEAAPSAREISSHILAAIAEGNLYGGLKLARRLLQHEGKVSPELRRASPRSRNRPPSSRRAHTLYIIYVYKLISCIMQARHAKIVRRSRISVTKSSETVTIFLEQESTSWPTLLFPVAYVPTSSLSRTSRIC